MDGNSTINDTIAASLLNWYVYYIVYGHHYTNYKCTTWYAVYITLFKLKCLGHTSMSSHTSIPFNYYTVCTCIPISITAVNSVVQECPPPLLPGPHTATLVAGSTTRITGSYVDNNSTVECFWSGPNATLSEATTSDLSSTNTRNSSRSTTIREAAACSSDDWALFHSDSGCAGGGRGESSLQHNMWGEQQQQQWDTYLWHHK